MKLYLETSVLSFLFADDAPEKREITKEFFRRVFKDNEVFISELVFEEIERCPEPKKGRLKEVIEKYDLKAVEITEEADNLASEYVAEGLIPERFINDAIHIALAAINNMDSIVSWNMSHIVKLRTKLGVNKVDRRLGYPELMICTPEEVV